MHMSMSGADSSTSLGVVIPQRTSVGWKFQGINVPPTTCPMGRTILGRVLDAVF